jgi:hypothetical protein
MGTKKIGFTTENNSYKPETKKRKFTADKKGSITKNKKDSYHDQRLSQSKWAFRLCFFGNIAGFAVIIWSIWHGVQSGDTQWPGIVSGIVIEATAALFYNISNKANEKISEFFIELTKDGNIEEAINLINRVKDDDVRDQLCVKLSLHLSGISEEKICKDFKDVCDANKKDI